jgi:hypothetical protein
MRAAAVESIETGGASERAWAATASHTAANPVILTTRASKFREQSFGWSFKTGLRSGEV